MSKLLFIVHSILNHRNQLIRKFIYCFFRPALVIGPVLFSVSASATIKIAFIDTGFCPSSQAKIKIHPVVDLTNSVKIDCKKTELKSPRLHGQRVLSEFLQLVDNRKTPMEIYPLIVFDAKGDQKKDYWLKAIDWLKVNKINLVLTAAGYITNAEEIKTMVVELPGIWFVPSGRLSPGVSKSTVLYPQGLAPKENLFLIGDYYDGKVVLYDQGLLYQDKIDFYFPSGKGDFTGTSRAVAEAAARALNLCSLSQLRQCLFKKSKEYVDGFSRKKLKTY